jgi:dTDP-D-glucose 4,6-dehydratase
MPKLFGPLRERYEKRPGGYTRVLRIEPKNDDQAASAILELVDGPKDMRYAMTVRAIKRQRDLGWEMNEMTQKNLRKVTRFRSEKQKTAVEALMADVMKLEKEERMEKAETETEV